MIKSESGEIIAKSVIYFYLIILVILNSASSNSPEVYISLFSFKLFSKLHNYLSN
jgi:hypothetical protein